MPRGNEPLGDIATLELFENDRVKIWSLIVEPGQTSPWHLHTRDYVTVVIEGEKITVESEDGTALLPPSEVGRWRYHDEHGVHRVINDGDTRYRNILIELKG